MPAFARMTAEEIGQVHELTFQIRDHTPIVLTLAGRGWFPP